MQLLTNASIRGYFVLILPAIIYLNGLFMVEHGIHAWMENAAAGLNLIYFPFL